MSWWTYKLTIFTCYYEKSSSEHGFKYICSRIESYSRASNMLFLLQWLGFEIQLETTCADSSHLIFFPQDLLD